MLHPPVARVISTYDSAHRLRRDEAGIATATRQPLLSWALGPAIQKAANEEPANPRAPVQLSRQMRRCHCRGALATAAGG